VSARYKMNIQKRRGKNPNIALV